jgi:hypothetical protein
MSGLQTSHSTTVDPQWPDLRTHVVQCACLRSPARFLDIFCCCSVGWNGLFLFNRRISRRHGVDRSAAFLHSNQSHQLRPFGKEVVRANACARLPVAMPCHQIRVDSEEKKLSCLHDKYMLCDFPWTVRSTQVKLADCFYTRFSPSVHLRWLSVTIYSTPCLQCTLSANYSSG